MMFASNDDFVKDFVERTILNYRFLEKGPYEVTALINSAIGVIILPYEKGKIRFTDGFIGKDLVEKLKQCSSKNTYVKPLDFYQILRHLRNGFAHQNWEAVAEKSPINDDPLEIDSIKLYDKNPITNESIDFNIKIELLREFFIKFSNAVISYFNEANKRK